MVRAVTCGRPIHGGVEFRPERHDQQHAKTRDPVHRPTERFQAGGVGPMRVLEDHQHRTLARQRLHLRNERFQRSLPALRRGQIERGIASIVRQRQHLGEERGVLDRGRGLREHRIELVELRLRRVVVRQSGGAFHLADDRIKRAVGVLRRAEIAQPRVRFAGEAFQQRRREPRFADAGLAGEQHHLAFAALRPGPAPQQQFEFFFPPDQRGQAARVQRLEAAFRRTRPQRRPGPRRPGDALEVLAPRGPASSNRLPSSLRVPSAMTTVSGSAIACRRAARFGVSPTTPRSCASPDPMRSPTTTSPVAIPTRTCKRRAGRGDELRRRLDDGEPGLHGALGVMFVGLGIAEIGEHAVAHVLGDETAVALDQLRAAAMIGADDPAHVLGIEPRRQRGRADEVAEHHGELAALGGVRRCWRGSGGCRLRRSFRRAQTCDRLEQALAVPEGHADLFEVAVRQLAQNLGVDVVLAK